MSPGIEETVALALYSPSKGAPVVTAVGDYSGFRPLGSRQTCARRQPQAAVLGQHP